MVFIQCSILWMLFAIVDSHSPLTEKKAEDGIMKSSCLPNEILINNLQNQINQETLIRISLLKQVYSLVGDMINLKNEMAAMKTNAEEIRRSTDDLRHEDNKILSEIKQMKLDQNYTSEMIMNETSEMIVNVQHKHNKILNEIEQKMKFNHNDTSKRIENVQHEYRKTFSEIEQKIRFNQNDTSEKIKISHLQYTTMFRKLEQNMESNHDDTSERIVNVQHDLLNVNNSVGLLHNYTDEIKAQYGIQEKTVRDLVSELERIHDRLGVLHTEDERMSSETQRMLVNYNETTLKMRDDLQNITPMANNLTSFHVQDCFEASHCWLLYSFDYDNSWNGCEGGAKYVKKTNYSSTPYLGVMICWSTRYKLFLSKTLTGKYYNIADWSGTGEDHCELLGTTRSGVLPGDWRKAPNTQELVFCGSIFGFFRYRKGQSFEFGTIGRTPISTGRLYQKWIDCGVNIPGDDRVTPM